MKRRNWTQTHNARYDRSWPTMLALLAVLVIIVAFCCGFTQALEAAAW